MPDSIFPILSVVFSALPPGLSPVGRHSVAGSCALAVYAFRHSTTKQTTGSLCRSIMARQQRDFNDFPSARRTRVLPTVVKYATPRRYITRVHVHGRRFSVCPGSERNEFAAITQCTVVVIHAQTYVNVLSPSCPSRVTDFESKESAIPHERVRNPSATDHDEVARSVRGGPPRQ